MSKPNKKTKRKRIKTHYKKKHCSPKQNDLDFSCLSSDSLKILAKALNKEVRASNPIDYKRMDDQTLYLVICDTMKDNYQCGSEACWIQAQGLMRALPKQESQYIQEHFRSMMPKTLSKDVKEWISNQEIDKMLRQYHKEINGFYYYDAAPIDFHKCSVSDICSINLKEHLDNKEHQLGFVFNTDDSDGPGQHWIAYYVDLMSKNFDQPGIYFFDSFGSKPMKQVRDLTEKLKQQGSSLGIEFLVTHNPHSFQKNTFSCGFYCMHFLEHMILGNQFDDYLQSWPNDKQMIQYRNRCFIHPDEI